MIQVVIADDEERICKLIQALVDWKALDMQIVGTASNGLEALELIEKKKPDILITDIRMPGCNGLELISKAREIDRDIHIVIISGYAHFEYAQTAVRYGVSDYLLKPINQQALQDTLSRLKDKVEKEKQVNQIQGKSIDISRLKGSLIQDLLEEQNTTITEEVIKSRYHMDIQTGYYQAFCLKMDYDTDTMRNEDVLFMQDKMKQILDCSIQKYCYEWVIVPKKGYVYGILNFSQKQTEKIRNVLRECLNQLEAQKKMLGTVVFSLGIGDVVKSPGNLRTSLAQAKLAVDERLIEGTGKLLELREGKSTLFEQNLLAKFSKRIDSAMELLSIEEAEAAVMELHQAIIDTPQVRGWEIQELIQSTGDIFALKLNISKDTLRQFEEKCCNSSSIEMLTVTLKEFATGLMQEMLEVRREDSSRPVRLAKQYIQNHYNEQLTLEEVSEKVSLTPAYFSILFKKETEVGFAKYLMNVRMEQAKTLLRESEYSVAEICKKVGYNDIKHFVHTFEKLVGVKPAAYRKLYG